MPIRRIVSVGLAICVGLGAMALIGMYGDGVRAPAIAATAPQRAVATGVPVVVAAAPIGRGEVLESRLLKVVRFPAGGAPPGAFGDIAQLVGAAPNSRLALRAMVPGEPILADRVSEPGGRANLSGALMPGLRAIGVKSNHVAGVGGFILPGDRVDVLATRVTQESSVIQVLAQNVRVLGVDQSDDQDVDEPHVAESVTVEVTPDEAQAISLAQAIGAVTLSLRQFGDQSPVIRRSLSDADLGSGGGRQAPSSARRSSTPSRPPAAGAGVAASGPDTAQVTVTRGVETAQYTVGR